MFEIPYNTLLLMYFSLMETYHTTNKEQKKDTKKTNNLIGTNEIGYPVFNF